MATEIKVPATAHYYKDPYLAWRRSFSNSLNNAYEMSRIYGTFIKRRNCKNI